MCSSLLYLGKRLEEEELQQRHAYSDTKNKEKVRIYELYM